MSYGYTPALVPAERFQRQFAADIVQCTQDLGVSDLLDQAELRQVLIYLNKQRPFRTVGSFGAFQTTSLREAQAHILHRLYSTWWAELMQEITADERQAIVRNLRIQLVLANNQDWTSRTGPLQVSFTNN